METKRGDRGFTLIELLIVIAVIAILAALAIPNMMSSRKAANETAAMTQVRDIVAAQLIFKTRRLGGDEDFATIAELGSTPVGAYTLIHWPDPANPGVRPEYRFEEVEAPTSVTYCIVASPVVPGKSGDRYFAACEDGHTRQSGAAPANRTDILAMPYSE